MKIQRFATAALTAVLCAAGAHATSPPTGEWNFIASLNDKPIGEHRFSVTGSGDERRLVGEANFNVKFIGISAYRYQHRVVEKWRGNCLIDLVSKTDDDGKLMRVRTQAETDNGSNVDGLVVFTDNAEGVPVPGCVMSFAYWNPAIQTQTRLLNAQTGKPEKVQVARAGNGEIEVRGQPTAATRWRISGAKNPIDVWYSATGEWVGLDSTVDGGRKLSYRLK
ncbi:hypothetical protein BH11PSE13_BH11PSE13_18650 [soil metagenome]